MAILMPRERGLTGGAAECNKKLLEEERKEGFLYLAGIILLSAQTKNGIEQLTKWTVESGVELFENDFSSFSNMATTDIMGAEELRWPQWFSTYMSLADRPFINAEDRFYGDQLRDMLSLVYVIFGTQLLPQPAVIPNDTIIPHINELRHVVNSIEQNPAQWSNVIDSDKLQELVDIVEK